MLDIIFIGLAFAMGGGASDEGAAMAPVLDGAASFMAEDQTPTGKFTTAGEVRPILDMTKGNWVAVREYGGQDLIYFTHLLAWRCGLHQIRYALNDGPMQTWDMPPCQTGTNAPNAIDTDQGLPYIAQPPGSVTSLHIELLYDDLSTGTATFQRSDVLMP